jgi:hypothetical protein
MDVIEGRKEVRFDLTEEGHYGEAGEDNRTIHLNKEAVIRGNEKDMKAKLAWYTGTMVHEGVHIDQQEWLARTGLEVDNETLERMAYSRGAKVVGLLDRKMGLSVAGSRYEEVAVVGEEFARTGNAANLDMSGRSLKVAKKGKTTIVEVEKWKNTTEGRKNSVEGIASELGVSKKEVIEALRRTGNYEGMTDEEIGRNLRVGERLVMKDGKVITEKEAGGIGGFFEGIKNWGKSNWRGVTASVTGLWEGLTGEAENKKKGQQLVSEARKYIGLPYKFGGGRNGSDLNKNGKPANVDCSSLVIWAFRGIGYEIPLNIGGTELIKNHLPGKYVPENQVREGTIVVLDYDTSTSKIDHLMIYTTNGVVLHAPGKGKTVEEGWTMKGVSNYLDLYYGEKAKIYFYQPDYRKLDEKYKRKNTGGKK